MTGKRLTPEMVRLLAAKRDRLWADAKKVADPFILQEWGNDLGMLLDAYEEIRALAGELARELDYTLRHEASCLEAISLHGKRCTCGYRHEDKRAALATARAAGLGEPA